MSKLILSCCINCCYLLPILTTQNSNTIIGVWKATDLNNSIIELYKGKDGLLFGKIIDSDEKAWIDKVIFTNGKYDSKEDHWQGNLYSLKRKVTIGATLSLASKNKLKVVGKKFFMTKTFYWESKEN